MRAATDPVASIERISERIHESEELIAHYETNGLTEFAAVQRRRLAGLRSALTRAVRVIS